MLRSVGVVRRSLEEGLSALVVVLEILERFTKLEKEKEDREESKRKSQLVDVYCKNCKETTPHEIEKRKGCSGEGIVGVCIFCSNVILLQQALKLRKTKEKREGNEKILES